MCRSQTRAGTCRGDGVVSSTSAFLTLAAITAGVCISSVDAFVPTDTGSGHIFRRSSQISRMSDASASALFSTPPPRRAQPRRNLKKRPRRRDKQRGRNNFVQVPTETDPQEERVEEETEWRPLSKARAVESGQDYWIDEKELRKVQEREWALKNRKLSVGEMPVEKLRTEVVAPYKQNWIGWFSVGIVMIATIVTQFPELLNTPVIPIPDL